MVDVDEHRKKKPKLLMVRLGITKALRSKVERELDMDLPMSHPLQRHPRAEAWSAKQLKEIETALERKATKEELEEMDARTAALDALGELEFLLDQWKKEEEDAKRVRKLEDEWDEKRWMERVKIPTGEELQAYLDALDQYAENLADEKVIREQSKQKLVKDIRELRRGVEEGEWTDAEIEAKIQAFVILARQTAKKVRKVQVKQVAAET